MRMWEEGTAVFQLLRRGGGSTGPTPADSALQHWREEEKGFLHSSSRGTNSQIHCGTESAIQKNTEEKQKSA